MGMKKIGIFTASTPIGSMYPKRLENAISFLEKKGHLIVKGNLISKSDTYRSGTIEQRVKEINYLLDSDIDILLSTIGGSNSSSLLPDLPYEKINAKRVTVCGFSDTTAILNAIVRNCPQARAIYAPALVPNFGSTEDGRDISYEYWFNVLTQSELELSSLGYYYTPKKNWKLLEDKYSFMCNSKQVRHKSEWKTMNIEIGREIVKGKLFGGNGCTLANLLSSDFVPAFPEGGILFIEDAEKNASEVERIFSSFLIHGILKKAKGIILGKHYSYKSKEKKQPWEILKEILEFNDLKTPVIYDVDVSHSRPMFSLELNKETIIDFKEKTIFQNLTK